MSAVRAGLAAAIVARLSELGCAVFDAPPVRAALPHAVVGDAVLTDAGASALAGLDARFAVTVQDAGERPVRLRALIESVEAAVLAAAGPIGGGWRIVRVALVRSRVVRGGDDRWNGTSEFAVRLYRDG